MPREVPLQTPIPSAELSDVSQASMQHLFEKLKKFWQLRLAPRGFPGLYLAVTFFVLVAASWLFGVIAEDVATRDRIIIIDARFSAWLHAHAIERLTRLMLLVTALHSMLSVTVVTLAVSAYLWIRRLRFWVIHLLLAVFGGMLLNFLLKIAFRRPRPLFDDPTVTLTTFSFPSGHTMMATVFYGVLCALVIARGHRWEWRAAAVLGSALMISLVGFSRIYLGAHFLSDVLAAIAEGLAWLGCCFFAVEVIRRRQSGNHKFL